MRNKLLLLGSCGSCLLLLLAIFPPVVASQQQQTITTQKNTLIQHYTDLARKFAASQPREMVWPFFLLFFLAAFASIGIITVILIYKILTGTP
jgi:hypothetical protein